MRTQTITSPKGKLGAMRMPKVRKISPARRSPARDQIQILDKSDPVQKVKIKTKKKSKEQVKSEQD